MYRFKIPLLALSLLPFIGNAQITLPTEGENNDNTVVGQNNVERDDWCKYYNYPVAQKKPKYNIAVFTPMFLDSINLANHLTRIPKFMRPGLDFYQGVEIAADTLRKKGYYFDIHVFDSRAKFNSIEKIVASKQLDTMDLIIGNADVNDLKSLAEYARIKEINFISAVSPSAADQEFNPYFTILQPTLQTHVQELHRVLNKKYLEDNVLYLYLDKKSELNALSYFENDDFYPLPGRFQKIEIDGADLDLEKITGLIDTNYNTTIVLGVLSPKLAVELLKKLQPLAKQTHLKVFGMPTMEMISGLNKAELFPDMKIFYSAAFVPENLSPATKFILTQYEEKMGGTPTDLVYKGFESVYFFANMMQRHGVPFNKYIGDNRFGFLTPFKIMPVKEKGVFQFYENKFLYILSFENGIMTYE